LSEGEVVDAVVAEGTWGRGRKGGDVCSSVDPWTEKWNTQLWMLAGKGWSREKREEKEVTKVGRMGRGGGEEGASRRARRSARDCVVVAEGLFRRGGG
jgi:hypothetical protein